MASEWTDHLRAHYERAWGRQGRLVEWTRGPIQTINPSFACLSVVRSPTSVAVATMGMSQPGDRSPLEVHMLVHPPCSQAVELAIAEVLVSVAHYHRSEKAVALGHTVNFGRSWLPGSTCSYGLISLPYLDGTTLEWTEPPRVRCLWLVPITFNERELKRKNGIEALESMFEAKGVDVQDPGRASVV